MEGVSKNQRSLDKTSPFRKNQIRGIHKESESALFGHSSGPRIGSGGGAGHRSFQRMIKTSEPLAELSHAVIPAKAGIQNRLKILDSGSRFACPE